MTQLQGLVFDVDGTLADTEEMHRQAFNRAFDEFKLDWNWTPRLYTDLLKISGGFERMRYFGADLRAGFRTEAEFEHFLRDLHRVKTSIYAHKLQAGVTALRPGVLRLLNEARAAGIRLAIATSTAASNVNTLLDAHLPAGWPTWFDAIVTADGVADKKPSPAVYLEALARTGLPADGCIALEDTSNGLRAARSAGIVTVVTTHYFTRHEHFPDAALVVDGLGEPDRPCRVRDGRELAERCIDVPLLSGLLSDSLRQDQRAGII